MVIYVVLGSYVRFIHVVMGLENKHNDLVGMENFVTLSVLTGCFTLLNLTNVIGRIPIPAHTFHSKAVSKLLLCCT